MTPMQNPEPLCFEDAAGWRAWLESHHDTAQEVWLLHVGKNSGRKGLMLETGVAEAIAYGWIDSKLKSLGDGSFLLRYSLRKPGSLWSKRNRDKAEELMREGRMTAAGLAAVEEGRRSGQWDKAYTLRERWEMPPDLGRALEENPVALENFEAFANSYRNQYIYWVNTAKTEATRRRRIAEVVILCADNIKPGQV
jgi:uncharacterized protein YdeI (YjbR/CyaY-like superfamily)